MKQCTILVSINDYGKINSAIVETFNSSKYKMTQDEQKISVKVKKLFRSYNIDFSIMTKESKPQRFSDMCQGLYSYFCGVTTKYEDTKQRLLTQISVLNAAIGISSEAEIDEDIYQKLLHIADNINAVIYTSQSIVDKYGKIILDAEGNSQIKEFVPVAAASIIDDKIHITKDGEARRSRTNEILKSNGVIVSENLPVIAGDEDVEIRNIEVVAKRAIGTIFTAMYACDVLEEEGLDEAKKFMGDLIEQYSAESFFTSKERAFMDSQTPDKQEAVQFAWRYECYWVLLWALGYVDKLDFPKEICDVSKASDILKNAEDYDNFLKHAVLRSKSEILDEADLIYRYDWACVEASINKETPIGELNPEVVVERHRALNWLINYMNLDWDNMRMDT